MNESRLMHENTALPSTRRAGRFGSRRAITVQRRVHSADRSGNIETAAEELIHPSDLGFGPLDESPVADPQDRDVSLALEPLVDALQVRGGALWPRGLRSWT